MAPAMNLSLQYCDSDVDNTLMVPPYPKFDLTGTFVEEQPNPRVKFQGNDNLVKGRGSVDKWAFHGCTSAVPACPNPRCPTRECWANWRLGKHGTIKPLMNGTASPRPHTAPPRVKPEAKSTAEVSKGGRMCTLLTKYGERGPTPRVPRVKPEAEATAEVHKGGRMNKLIHSYGRMPLSARAVPRVKQEAEDNAELDKGKRLNGLIHKYRRLPLSARPVPRVKPEAEDNADLDKGKRMKRLIHSYGRLPLSARAVPRVKSEAQGNADLDKGKRMERLIHSCESLPKSPRSAPRIKPVEGKNNQYRGRGTMGKMLRDMGNRTCIFKPGMKKSSYLKTAMI